MLPTEAEARSYSAIVVEAESGRVLYARKADHKRYPASLTKMMTLYMTFEAVEQGRLRQNQKLVVSRRAAGMPASKLGLKRGSSITVRDAILALVTKSANDASVVLAEAMGGTEIEFAKQMTARARQLGMKNTTFRNASGLPNRRQRSTARDMAILAWALIRDFPQHYEVFSATSFKYKGRRYRNHNRLLKTYAGTDGIKTGYIRASGYNLAASTVRRGKRLIAVVFGGKSARSRDRHMAKLLNKGFAQLPRGVAAVPAPPRRNPFQVAALPPRQSNDIKVAAKAAPQVQQTQTVVLAKAQPKSHQQASSARLASAQVGIATGTGANSGTVTAAPAVANIKAATPTAQPSPRVTAAPVKAVPPQPAKPAAVQTARLPALPQPAAATPMGQNWGVQVGAYSRFGPAHSAVTQAARTLPELLLSTKTVISQISGANGPLYRAQLTGLSEPRAREACRLLTSAAINCVVVPPQVGAGANAGAG